MTSLEEGWSASTQRPCISLGTGALRSNRCITQRSPSICVSSTKRRRPKARSLVTRPEWLAQHLLFNSIERTSACGKGHSARERPNVDQAYCLLSRSPTGKQTFVNGLPNVFSFVPLYEPSLAFGCQSDDCFHQFRTNGSAAILDQSVKRRAIFEQQLTRGRVRL